ncbi:MAG: LysE family translocator [Campylobacteraceae bacterium]|nr:LysE family translocator [Campylobacteraceae bacterium]
MEIQTLLLFMGASALLAISPGPDIIYVITLGITRGTKAAIITTFGLTSGIFVHTTAAALGISVIFQTSALAFNIVKFAGAAYLFYLAFQAFKHRADLIHIDKSQKTPYTLKKLYFKGFLMNVLNPKVSLFFLAFLPQFVNPSLGSVPWQMIQLGLAFMVATLIIFSFCGILAHRASATLMERPNFAKTINTIAATVFVALGLKLVFSQR